MSGMRPEDRLRVELPTHFLDGTVSDLLDRVFPADGENQEQVLARFDLRANPDLPEIYGVFLAVCEEWRDWRCALRVSTGGGAVALNDLASRPLIDGDGSPVLTLRMEQEYRALEYAVRHGLGEGRKELLGWMRPLTVLYFLDKHSAELPSSPGFGASPALAKSLDELQSQGIIGLGKMDQTEVEGQPKGDCSNYGITLEGRRFISELLSETESCIDQFDHYQDVLVDTDGEEVEFGTGRGLDLRVQAFLAEGMDPIRTVFLLRIYDGTLDARLRDWTEVLETEEFFEALLEPVANRDGVPHEAMELVLEQGYAWLEDRQDQLRRDRQDQEILARARRNAPRSPRTG